MTIIAVSGLMREARIASGPGVRTLAGGTDAALLRQKLERAIAEGAQGIISIGIAGGVAPSLKSGDCVVGSSVLEGGERFFPDIQWTARIIETLPSAIPGVVAGVDAVMTTSWAKAALFRATGAHVVDMESHIVARVAKAHGLPFAVLRTISDPVGSTLPPLVATAVTDSGQVDLMRVLSSLLADPRQIPALIQTARESKAAFEALLRCRRALGLRLLGPNGSKLALDMG
jgi:adenosylhomocysteine nucleosidase